MLRYNKYVAIHGFECKLIKDNYSNIFTNLCAIIWLAQFIKQLTLFFSTRLGGL